MTILIFQYSPADDSIDVKQANTSRNIIMKGSNSSQENNRFPFRELEVYQIFNFRDSESYFLSSFFDKFQIFENRN